MTFTSLDLWSFRRVGPAMMAALLVFAGYEGSAWAGTISTCAQLQNIANDLTGTHWLTADIDCLATRPGAPDHAGSVWEATGGFEPIGSHSASWQGSFDGQGFTVSNLYVSKDGLQDVAGLFGVSYANMANAIQDVRLENVFVRGGEGVGGLIGVSETNINNVHVTGVVIVTREKGGGVVGNQRRGNLTNSTADVEVSCGDDSCREMGGLAGHTEFRSQVRVENCSARGNVYCNVYCYGVGGLIGTNYVPVFHTFATGNVRGTESVGSFVGSHETQAIVDDSFATGRVECAAGPGLCTFRFGGFAGRIYGWWGASGHEFQDVRWNVETSGITTMCGEINGGGGCDDAKGKTTAQMRQAASFSGFDFGGAWAIQEGQTFPYLQAFGAPACSDDDGDGYPAEGGACGLRDNCPDVANATQADTDSSYVGDACNASADPDGDEIEGPHDHVFKLACADQQTLYCADNCPGVSNSDQADTDGDTQGDACIPGSANDPPAAVAGDDISAHAGDTVQLDGSESFDDNTPAGNLGYSWAFVSVPGGSTAVLTGADTSMPTFVADVSGTYVLGLVVTDAEGLSSAADEVEVSSNNMAPTSVAGADQLVILGASVNLEGSGSTDPEGDSLAFSWSITTAPAGSTASLVGEDTEAPSLLPDIAGVYEIKLDVSDFIGAGTPDTVAITVATTEDFAQIQIAAAADVVSALTLGEFAKKGNQKKLLKELSKAVQEIQKGKPDEAIKKLNKVIERTDGCVLRGSPDGNGKGRDWITDCDEQTLVYQALVAALGAISP